jgi:hypothetical protein
LLLAAATPLGIAATAAGFAVPLAVASFIAGRVPRGPELLDGVLGFLAVGTLLWISHQLGPALLRHELALLQLAWLGVALGLRLGAGRRGGSGFVWWTLAAAAAALSLWLVRSAG